ncbi:MAG: pre-peptidase C-terminal domain-containing protein, partial [Gemmataceae bacterium]
NRQPSGLPAPRLYALSPAGAKVGTSVEVLLAGFHLEDAKLIFSHPGIKAEPVPEPPPPIDPKTKQPKMPAAKTPTTVKFKVSVAAEVPLGNHEVRVVNRWGVSNTRVFQVGDCTEVAEIEPNNDIDGAPNKPQRVEINTTVNATFNQPNDVDYYVFKAAKGQRVVVTALSSTVDSRAQPAIEIFDTKGRQVGENVFYNDDDAVIDVTAPEEGDYYVRVYQFTHVFRPGIQGGMPPGTSDQFYRLSIRTAPWIDAIVPSVIEPGKTVTATVWGRNLPNGKPDPNARLDGVVLEKATVNITAPADAAGQMRYTGRVLPAGGLLDGFEFRLKNAAGSSNPYLIGVARAVVIVETGDNDTPEKAQAIPLPCEIAGVVEKRNDADWYQFTAKKGEVWLIDVTSNALGAPTFMTFTLRNPRAKGGEIYEAPLEANPQSYSRMFFQRSEDPRPYRFVVPEDGDYQLLVTSRAAGTMFGPRHTYSVRITPEPADFRLVALGEESYVPSVTTVPAGGHQALNIVVERQGRFTGEVELSVEGLPPGVTCPPQVLAGAVREAALVISAAPGTADWQGPIRVKGTALINGNKISREARSAGLVWPVPPGNNIPCITRLERETWLAIRGKPVLALTPSLDKSSYFPGDKGVCKIKVDRVMPEAKAAIQLGVNQTQNRQGSELPQNLRFNNNQPIAVNPGQAEATLNLTIGPDVPPGEYTVVFRAQTQVPYSKDPKGKPANVNTVTLSPPVRLEVLPKALAKFSVATTNLNAKIGQKTELPVRVERLYGFDGEFKVKVELPSGVQGVNIAELTIPAGANEAKLLVEVPANAMPGNRANLVVKATALWKGKTPTVHETKFNVNVVK